MASAKITAPGQRRYKAFISYSHRADRALAAALESALEKLGKPWNQRRNFAVFRDDTGLSINPGLWPAIETALADSEYLLVLASPDAARSPWVRKEIDYWFNVARRAPDTLLIALTGGTIAWDEATRDFDWSRTDALPREMSGTIRGGNEPLWADFGEAKESQSISISDPAFRRPSVKIAARLLGVSPADLDGEDLQQHQRTIRIFRGLIVGLLLFLTVALGFLWYAIQQRNTAIQQRNLALARQLAMEANLALTSDIDPSRSALLALESVRLNETAEGKQALANASSRLIRPIARAEFMPEERSSAISPDGKLVAVASWSVPKRAPFNAVFEARTGRLISHISGQGVAQALAFSPDNRTLAASMSGKVGLADAISGANIREFAHDGCYELTFSPDGQMLAITWGIDKLTIRDVASGREIVSVNGVDSIFPIAFSPDSSMLVVPAKDKSSHVIDVKTGRQLSRVSNSDYAFGHVFSPDSRLVLSGTQDRIARVFEARTGTEVFRIAHQGAVSAVAFSPDGSLFATGSSDQTARVFRTLSGEEVGRTLHQGGVNVIAFSPDGHFIATGASDAAIRIIEARTGRELARAPGRGAIIAVAFDPAGESLIAVSKGGLISAFDVKSAAVTSLLPHTSEVYEVALNTAAMRVATRSFDKFVRVFDLGSGQEIVQIKHQWPIIGIALSQDGHYVASGSEDMNAAVLDVQNRRELIRIWHPEMPISVAISPDSKLLVTGARDAIARVYELGTRRLRSELRHDDRVCAVVFAKDGKSFLTGSYDKSARLFDTASWREIRRFPTAQILCNIGFSDDDQFIVILDQGRARLFDRGDGREVLALAPPKGVNSIVFAGGFAAVQTGDDATEVIQIPSGRLVLRDVGPGSARLSALTADGRLLAVAQADQTLRVLELANGREIARFRLEGAPRAIGFSQDGRLLHAISGHIDLRYQRFSFQLSDLVKDTCGSLLRNLSEPEWNRHLGSIPYQRTCSHLNSLAERKP